MSDQQVFVLADVLSRLRLPDDLAGSLPTLSRKWRCVIAPRLEDGEDPKRGGAEADTDEDEDILRHLDRYAEPVFLSRRRAERVYEKSGGDGINFVCGREWNKFPKPQIAVRRGWGSPGTVLESSTHHKMIGAFDEVFHHKEEVVLPETAEERTKAAEALAEEDEQQSAQTMDPVNGSSSPGTPGGDCESAASAVDADEVLEMQLFHRDDPASCPQLPPLGNELVWPSFLGGSTAVVCDVDTVVSQRGARQWWRLHDSGEFVMQCALSAPDSAFVHPSASTSPHPAGATTASVPELSPAAAAAIDAALFGRSAAGGAPEAATARRRKPVRLVLCGPKGSYDWFVHDDEATVRGRVTALDLFQTPDEALPMDGTLLPVLTVAVVEAGGAPLLLPPNLPSLVVTLNDCVVVEQRRISHVLWLDEVSYFLCRTAHWASTPLIYEFVEKDLQSAAFVAGELIPTLMDTLRRHDGQNPFDETVRRRVTLSLLAIASHEKHFSLEEGSRQSLVRTLESDADTSSILHSTALAYCYDAGRFNTLKDAVQAYWDAKAWWPRAGCVLLAPPLSWHDWRQGAAQQRIAGDWFVPVVYCNFRPVFGTEKATVQETLGEYLGMKELEASKQKLCTFLRLRKQKNDEVLDELF